MRAERTGSMLVCGEEGSHEVFCRAACNEEGAMSAPVRIWPCGPSWYGGQKEVAMREPQVAMQFVVRIQPCGLV